MTYIDPLSYIKAALARDFAARQTRPAKPESHALLITVSRDYGALGEAIAYELSRALNLPVYDREILEQIAANAKADKHHFASHDEQPSSGLSGFLYSMVSGNPTTLRDYRRHLCQTLLELAKKDSIFIGRGAHLILSGRRAFRIRIVGSKTVCAHRIALELDIPLTAAEHKVTEVNQKRHKAILDLFHDMLERCSLEHADLFDLVINTDHISANAAVKLILLTLRESSHIAEIPPWIA
jgi:cytidylate kinase